MSEVVNLRQARKRKARADAERDAAERRARFGRSRTEIAVETARREQEIRALDGHLRDGGDEG